ncbi:hypothetical protein QTP70_018085, partial [Hemibagrus guttatus]
AAAADDDVLNYAAHHGNPEKVYPCGFFSRKLTAAEANYDVGNRKLLFIKEALDDSDIPQYEEKYMSDGEVFTFPGPLMRTKMQKDKLMRFIQEKCQECLLHLNEPQQQKSYFFWSIMERFCNRNGRVMMSEIGTLLFKGYGFLRRKLQRVENQEDWCLPLANLLCSAAPKDKHREAIIEMGDKFASRGWTYAAHLCYVAAQLDLGLRPRFKVVGCDSLPETKSAMREVIERTEVYEYVLSLTSGFGQTHFQEFKYVHACELADAGLDDLALDYCENVAAAVLTFPECTQSTLMEWVILLSEKLLQMREEEPEWLTKFRQLLQDRLAQCSSSDDQKQISSEAEESDHLLFDPSNHIEFNSLYTVGEPLGEGGFGLVYAGVRKADGKQVAVKCAAKDPYDEFLDLDAESNVPLEVALMKMVSKFSTCENIVELLDWFEASDFYILVLERPVPCMDLYQFCKPTNRRLSEPVARVVMQQVVQAARHCCEHGVLHRDIKPQNILINPDTLTVKLIDFGCGAVLTEGLYKNYAGTDGYYPPEWVLHKEYFGVPATVWSLGVVLFQLVCGQLPFMSDSEIVEGQLRLLPDLSEECCDLIEWCLKQDPESRPSFMNILSHKWLTEAEKATVKLSEELLQRREEQPEWLTKLCQFLEDRVSQCNSSDDQKQISSEAEESDHLQFDPSIHIEFNSLYTVGEPLGEGGFGLVYAGVRKADGKQVAVKCAAKDPYDEFLDLDGESNVPLEVALMKMVSKFSTCENIVELLDWFEASEFYILVLERPVPCMDLYEFCKPTNHRLSEPVARVVMQQVVQAARHCCEHGVLHRDIKPQNILINPDTLTVKLIDFGCGAVLTEGLYKNYAGTDGYYPPEWVLHKEYFGVPATVWSLGVVLFELVCGQLPFMSDSEIVEGQLRLLPDLSEECCDLIEWCLKQDPESRPSFMNILSHKWLTEADKATVKVIAEFQQIKSVQLEPKFMSSLDLHIPKLLTMFHGANNSRRPTNGQTHHGNPGKVYPCGFFSRKLTAAEANYDVTNRELLFIQEALEYSYPTSFDRELVPLKALPTAKETATTLFHYIFRTYGLPKDIVSDRAPSSPLGFGGPSVLTSELIGHASNSKNIIKYYWLWNTGWLGQYKGKNLDQILID